MKSSGFIKKWLQGRKAIAKIKDYS